MFEILQWTIAQDAASICPYNSVMIEIGLNMEFIRCEGTSRSRAGVARAAELGYKWVEPMVHNGRELAQRGPGISIRSQWITTRSRWRRFSTAIGFARPV